MANDTNVLVRKLKLTIINDNEEERKEQYQFIRDAQYRQYQLLNRYMSYIVSELYRSGMDLNSERYKAALNVSESSNLFNDGITYGTGVDTKSLVKVKVEKDISTAIKNGFMKGERSINNYKRTFPLMTYGRDLRFEYDDNNNVIIKWVHKIKFKVVLSSEKKNNNDELMHTLHKVINKEYKVAQSSLMFDKKKLILNLSIHFPKKEKTTEIVKGRTLGVDLGIKIPAYASLNDDIYTRQSFGNVLELAKAKKQFKERRARIYKQMSNVKGGKGRKKKMKAAYNFSDKERKFTQNYNHQLSRRIVDFAKANNCEYINMEHLEGDSFKDKKVLGVWTYYELQQYIKYKAEMEGIKVRFVNPAYTSQTCSKCGYVDEENRPTQERFKCKKCGFEMNADRNASINISRKTEDVKKKKPNIKKDAITKIK